MEEDEDEHQREMSGGWGSWLGCAHRGVVTATVAYQLPPFLSLSLNLSLSLSGMVCHGAGL